MLINKLTYDGYGIPGADNEGRFGCITQKIHYVGDFALYIQTGGATPTNKHEYLHRDHLDSIAATSNINCQSDDLYTGNNMWLDA